MSPKLSQIGEFGLVDIIRRNAYVSDGVLRGIGDDTAVLKNRGKELLLFTTDMLAEGIHFSAKTRPEDIGHKALACSISDVAAMGGLPVAAVISLGAPGGLSVKCAKGIFRGINRLAKKFDISIVGGDTIRSKNLTVNLALLGYARKKNLVLRSGAAPGDIIFVTGPLGGSLKSGRHLKFTPRIPEAQYLVKYFKPSSMIDVSDGLIADLGHILSESGVSAYLYQSQIPVNPRASILDAFYGGEDFELLLTLSPQNARKVLKKKEHPLLFPIGQVVKGKGGLKVVDKKGQLLRLKGKKFDHYR